MNLKNIFGMLAIVLVSLCIVSCDKDDSGTIDNPSTASDPAGTIVANLRNSGSNGEIYITTESAAELSIRMNEANNLHPYWYGQSDIVSVGAVNGIASITRIPDVGWADEVAAIPGYGYILRYKYDPTEYHYVRLYVVDYIEGTSGGIIGCVIKYQLWK